MRILGVNLENKDGLTNIKMKRLDKVVLIAGKNGSGKSRLLKQIETEVKKKVGISNIKMIKEEISKIKYDLLGYNHVIPIYQKNIDNYKIKFTKIIEKQPRSENDEQEINNLKLSLQNEESKQKNNQNAIIKYTDLLSKKESILNNNSSSIKTDDIYEEYTTINFLPNSLNLDNPDDKTSNQIKEIIDNDTLGLDIMNKKAFAIINDISHNWFLSTHTEIDTDNMFNTTAKDNYNKLKFYIKKFLDTDLSFQKNTSNPTLFGFKLGEKDLSNGQIILLQLCIAIYLQENDLEKIVIFMDEPENHLHPKALIEVINKLSEIITEGQIWIATHSINLLSNFEPKNIWYMENGSINHAGKIPEKVLEGLLGDKDDISKLENFISLPAQMATNNFAFECLFEPLQVETGVNDPQVGQIIDAIKTKHNASGKVKILDFGAGKGRLLSTIDEIGQNKNIPTLDWLDYYAYDLPSDNKQKCIDILNNIYEDGENRYFDDESSFINNTEENTFDMIVLSNVFHEIDHIYWNNVFGEGSLINHGLKDDGVLLIIEDQLIPVGEKAYQNGFLVFDKAQFKKLFDIPNYNVEERRDGRLKAHFIEKSYLKNITTESKKVAIESLKTSAQRKVLEIRGLEANYENGKLHAFWTQQLANSYLVCSQL